MGHYGILLTDRALYLYSPFWLPFARWRRLLLKDIRNIEFRNAILWPCLRVHLRHGQRALRTPWDHREEMDYDRKMLIGTVAQVLARLPPKAEHAASIADPRDDAS